MRVLITGSTGRIGREVVDDLTDAHEIVRVDRRASDDGATVAADLDTPGDWMDRLAGVDAVVHLAAEAGPDAPWETVRADNVEATWNVLDTAARHGVERVVFASSNWAVKALERELAPDCYRPEGPKIGSDAPPRPIGVYGLSKAFGEVAGRTLVDEGRLRSFVAVRIGAFAPRPGSEDEWRRLWIGPRDVRSLFRRCVEADLAGAHVVYGVSAQAAAPYDLSHTRSLLSWRPRHTA